MQSRLELFLIFPNFSPVVADDADDIWINFNAASLSSACFLLLEIDDVVEGLVRGDNLEL